jgi:rSAM/selenodomain-associated transferase 1
MTRAAIAIFARAPVAGATKTRLIPALGAEGAACLHAQLLRQAVTTACASGLGPVTLWCAPDCDHAFFRTLAEDFPIALASQAAGDLGERMLRAFEHHGASGPMLLIGTDCPALTTQTLHDAAVALAPNQDAVFVPAEDGGYVLVGLHRPERCLFENLPWGGSEVMAQTRVRLRASGLRWRELAPLWDVDRPEDLPRLDRFQSNRNAA